MPLKRVQGSRRELQPKLALPKALFKKTTRELVVQKRLLKLKVLVCLTSAKVAEMVKYLAEFKEFNQRFQKSMYASHKELWTEINSIKSKRRHA